MKNLVKSIKSFLAEEEGLTTVEYAVAGSLVAAVTVTAFTDLGTGVCNVINGLTSSIGQTFTGSC